AIARGDSRFISSGIGFFNDGADDFNVTISRKTVTLEATVGPYLRGTVITYSAILYDIFGGVFVTPELQYTVTTDPLEPTSTTTTTGDGGPIVIDPVLLLGIVGGVVVIVVIVVFFNKKRSGM
ncbi:MAG: hypothetical protein ACFFEE_11905, partial [Candidatus Thorarchaeota archaeon]